MKVLVADKFEDSGRRGLAEIGCEVAYEPDAQGDDLGAAIERTGAPVLVVRSTKVTRAMLEKGQLALVVRAGAGVNTIDVEAASERGIWVANCPGKNAIAVAELTFALLLALDRRVVEAATDLRAGTWNKKEYGKARGLYGRSLGVLGAGMIGREVIRRAQAFGMHVHVWARTMPADLGDVHACGSITEVASHADVLSVHLALNAHIDRVGVLAAVFDCLRRAEINVQETENIVFEGARAAIARIHVDHAPGPEVLAALQSCSKDILAVTAVAI